MFIQDQIDKLYIKKNEDLFKYTYSLLYTFFYNISVKTTNIKNEIMCTFNKKIKLDKMDVDDKDYTKEQNKMINIFCKK